MKCLELSVLFSQSLESALFYLLFSPAGETMMNLAALIGSSPLSLFIFTVVCFIGLVTGIGMILYAAKETVYLVREVIQEKEK
jgi:hypothetical protein